MADSNSDKKINTTTTKVFRLQAKKLFLTYSRTTISKEDVLNQLKQIFKHNIKDYFICQENHQFQKDDQFLQTLEQEQEKEKDQIIHTHIHAYIGLKTKADILDPHKLDLIHNNEIIHGHYLTVYRFQPLYIYLKKEDQNPLTNLKYSEGEDDFNTTLMKICDQKGSYMAQQYYEEQRPIDYFKNYIKISARLKAYSNRKPLFHQPLFDVTQFTYPKSLLHWFNTLSTKTTLILVGQSDFGKTQAISAYLKFLDHRVLRVSNIDTLKSFDSNLHTAIIFDDFNWTKINRAAKIQLFDKDTVSDVKVIYGLSRIKPETLKIIICNNLGHILHDEQNNLNLALVRRVSVVYLDQTLITKNRNEKNQKSYDFDKLGIDTIYQQHTEKSNEIIVLKRFLKTYKLYNSNHYIDELQFKIQEYLDQDINTTKKNIISNNDNNNNIISNTDNNNNTIYGPDINQINESTRYLPSHLIEEDDYWNDGTDEDV
jgi:hypothetical protein